MSGILQIPAVIYVPITLMIAIRTLAGEGLFDRKPRNVTLELMVVVAWPLMLVGLASRRLARDLYALVKPPSATQSITAPADHRIGSWRGEE